MEKKTNKMKIGLIIGVMVILVSLTLSASTYKKTANSEWVCIAEECSEFATGEEWVKQNCKLEDNEMFCYFEYQSQDFRVPLMGVNISNMVSCAQYECSSQVLIKYNAERGGN